jgi:hypothetical protein
MGYPVMVLMYLKGESYPFVGYTSIDVAGDALLPIITWEKDASDPNIITFSAESSKGSNIDWQQCRWTFGDTSEAGYGAVAAHKYALSSYQKTYKVSLTVNRRSVNGVLESKTVYRDVNIKSEELKAFITVKENNNGYMVLSAEDSEGRSLQLDRSVWLFEGTADSESLGTTDQGGTIIRTQTNDAVGRQGRVYGGVSGVVSISSGFNPFFKATASISTGVEGEIHGSHNETTVAETVDYSGYTNNNYNFSSSNQHTGAICRRYFKPNTALKVTLLVYRLEGDSSLKGESVTVLINANQAVGVVK